MKKGVGVLDNISNDARHEWFRKRINVDETTGCWVWQRSKINMGYGHVHLIIKGHVETLAHRVAFRVFVGDIPGDLELDHLCHNRACCNPAHLELVTSAENTHRGIRPPPKSHCRKGHIFDESNTLIGKRSDGQTYRICRICKKAWHELNSEKQNARQSAWRKLNIEKARAQAREGARRRYPANAEKLRERCREAYRKRYALDPEKLRARRREEYRRRKEAKS